MIYRPYGQTGKKVSLLGFGGMRFADIDNQEQCVSMMLRAAEGGVNYFDTAPDYFGVKSEQVYGKGFAELKRRGLPFYSATKTFRSSEDDIRRELENQLTRLGLPAVDFYHVWCVASLDSWRERKKKGILKTFNKLKEEGLIRHICVSSHLTGNEIRELLMEGVFEGVLFGYSAYNFKTRQEAFNAIREKKLGAVVMNPLGGGLIPQHPEKFTQLLRPGETAVSAALRFLWDHQEISSTLVGFQTIAQIEEALAAMEGYVGRSAAELAAAKEKAVLSMEGICTGCGYCEGCPRSIPIPQFMDAYNQKLLDDTPGKDAIGDRLKWHWHLKRSAAAACTACGQCETACTQRLPIMARLKEIAG